MESDYQKSSIENTNIETYKSQPILVWMIVGIGMGIVFSFMVGNVGVGLIMGIIVSFLTGIICKRTRIIEFQ